MNNVSQLLSIEKYLKGKEKMSIIKLSKLFSKTKKPSKIIYRFLGIKWVRHNRYAKVLNLIRQSHSEILVAMQQNQDAIKNLKKEMLEYKKTRNTSVKPAQTSDLIDKYKSKFYEGGYSVERRDNKIRIWDNTLTIEGTADNTLWTSVAVLCSDEYHFDIDDEYVMFDIGLNLGITSLHKARDKNCVKIYGYEPFTPTFKQAQDNMNLNPQLSQKISIFNYGLGDTDKELDINYNPDRPGAMSSVKNVFPECGEIERITIKEASKILAPLINKHNEKIFLKIDCEGAEKEILPNLDKAGLLKKVDVIIMEWHFENPEWIIDLLKENNFVVFRTSNIPNNLGMIRAYRRY